MAILQVRDIDDRLYSLLRDRARLENRSISQEVVTILEAYLANPTMHSGNPTREFLSLSGSWEDNRSSAEIVQEIRRMRKNSRRFEDADVLFD
jgi:plasmid stability protein